jgi:type IV pilus assembly protein PilB
MSTQKRTGPEDHSERIAELLVSQELITEQQLTYARRVSGKLGDQYSLLQVLQQLELIQERQIKAALKAGRGKIPLGALLVGLGYIRAKDLDIALRLQQTEEYRGKRLGEVLLERRLLTETKLTSVLADHLGYERVDANFTAIDRKLLDDITPQWCREHMAMPLKREPRGLLVGFADPSDGALVDQVQQLFGTVVPVVSSRRSLNDAINAFAGSIEFMKQVRKGGGKRLGEGEVAKLVDQLIIEALKTDTSDIHIEPTRHALRIRLRRDGIMMPHKELDSEIAPKLISRLKILGNADIAEKRRHQDGNYVFSDPESGYKADIRMSFYSTIFGEKVVLRLLARKAELLDIKEIGMTPRLLERFTYDVLDVPTGVILITGPTGSGKTTSLYAAVNYLNNSERAIVTAEDPVEYVIDGIAQCSLNPKINLTFEETLRHMVRQDPDVIVMGEVRDQFSAEAAVQAALTGHKVLTTFHTEDSIGGLLRLMNMNIESFLISSTVVSVLAQRLLRRVCGHCAEPYVPSASDLQRLNCTQEDLKGARFRTGTGCPHCYYTGYSGRIGIYELLVLNEPVKEAILERRTSHEIRQLSIDTSGLTTLFEDGLAKASQGLTSISEILRNLPRIGRPRPLRDIIQLVGEVPHV